MRDHHLGAASEMINEAAEPSDVTRSFLIAMPAKRKTVLLKIKRIKVYNAICGIMMHQVTGNADNLQNCF